MKKDITTDNDANIHSEGETHSSYFGTPWCGNLDECELSRPGALLLAALFRCANKRYMQLDETAKELGVTSAYINQLRNGKRPVSQISDEFAIACARFLGASCMTVLMLAGRVNSSDLFGTDNMMAVEISKAMRSICDDINWGHLVTPEMRRADEITQFGVVKLYEAATGKVLMDKALDCQSLATQLVKLKEIQANWANAVHEHSLKEAELLATKAAMEAA